MQGTALQKIVSLSESKYYLWILLGLFVIWLVWAVNVWFDDKPVLSRTLPLDPSCDLRAGPCETSLPEGGKVSFAIAPRSIPVVKPLQLEVFVDDQSIDQVSVDISGVDMNMGTNLVKMISQGNGSFTGNTSLSVCIRDVMEWEAKVLLRKGNDITQVPYRFITTKTYP